jgi:hypothetical protein
MMLLALAGLLAGQVPPFTARFEQVTLDAGRTDTVRGTIYFAAPWRVYYDVDFPLRQQLSVVKNTMTVYYPDETLAYVIRSGSPVESPMAQHSLHAVDERQTMAKMGFRLAETRQAAETTYHVWRPKNPRMPFSRISFGRVGRAAVYVEVLRQQEKPLLRTRLSDHIRADTFYLPARIETERFDTEGRRTLETLTYTGLDTSRTFMQTLGRFTLPPGTRTKTSDW